MPENETKKCTKCTKRKSLTSFHRNVGKRDGRHSQCKQCRNTSVSIRVNAARLDHRGRAQALWKDGRNRARKKRVDWTLPKDWIADRVALGKCERTGIQFELENSSGGWRNPRAPSIHRVDSSRGYTPDNCQMVAYQYNAALNEWPEELFAELAKAYVKTLH